MITLVEYGEGTMAILVQKLLSYIQASLTLTHIQSFREEFKLIIL